MHWSRLRVLLYGLLGATLTLGLVQAADQAGFSGLVASFGCLAALAVIFDVVYQTVRGKTQPCPSCGHSRPHRPFRISPPCPRCGKL